ncbi:hypothetical protein D3C76_1355610 [compost metagenome]
MILLPLPLDSCGRSLTGNISIRPAWVIASSISLSFSITSGAITCALSGRLIIALPARLRAIRSLKVQMKPYPASEAISSFCSSPSISI